MAPVRPFARRPRFPQTAQAALHLARAERVLAFQQLGEATLVATDHRLVVLEGDGQGATGGDEVRVLDERPWHEAENAAWDDESRTLRIRWVDGAPTWGLPVDEPDRDLMTTIRARIQSTLVTAQSSKVGGRTVRVALRRDLATGDLLMQHQYGQGLRAGDPRVAAAVASMEAAIRDDAGLPPDFASGA